MIMMLTRYADYNMLFMITMLVRNAVYVRESMLYDAV